jgi:hypothetical protein
MAEITMSQSAGIRALCISLAETAPSMKVKILSGFVTLPVVLAE